MNQNIYSRNWRYFFSLIYSVGQIGLGLLLHPYQTMQDLVEHKLFIWMALFPTLSLGVVTIIWRYLVVPLVRTQFSCMGSSFWGCVWLLPLVANWITIFCLYWQLLIWYLLIRFKRVYS